ncbi:MAG: hypothetical protein LBL18_00585 [Bacteroidales bacterium]|jgi:hypothetical protein|nr:hypothetical protein [Bacteroidales bacterium]
MITGTFKTVTAACLLLALAALLASSCHKPEPEEPAGLEVQNKPQRPGSTEEPVPIQPRIERWLRIASYVDQCGFSYGMEFYGRYGKTTDLRDTFMGAAFVNWTDSTYLSRRGLKPDGTFPDYPLPYSGKITYTGNGGNPDIFPVIEFDQGFEAEEGINKWEISYFGDYTSVPSRPFAAAVSQFYIEKFNIPNQFVALRTDKYQGNHELILYFVCFSYPY